jgi:hypothetical protein
VRLVVAYESDEGREVVDLLLHGENLTAEWHKIPRVEAISDLRASVEEKLRMLLSGLGTLEKPAHLIAESFIGDRAILGLRRSTKPTQFFETVGGPRAREQNWSRYVLTCHQKPLNRMSSTHGKTDLANFTRNGSVVFDRLPLEWFERNEYIAGLATRPYYRNLLDIATYDIGVFLKVARLESQKNYWYIPLNGGLPVTRKRDPIHEGTYLLHDIFHFTFDDPLMLGVETELERKAYLAYRMMSEACSLVAADMFSVAHADIEHRGYPTDKRQIYPMFQSSKGDALDARWLFRFLYATCTYSLFGDVSAFRSIGCGEGEIAKYRSKYSRFFAVDYQWNDANLTHITSLVREHERLREYYSRTAELVGSLTSHELLRVARLDEEHISFDKLLVHFWDRLTKPMVPVSERTMVRYLNAALPRYIAGQVRLAYQSEVALNSGLLDKLAAMRIPFMTAAEALEEYAQFGEVLGQVLEQMLDAGEILPHEVALFNMHVPHFPPMFASYDRPETTYPSLEALAARFLGDSIVREADLDTLVEKYAGNQVQQDYRISLSLN